jgi:hypothetical protein
MSTAASPIEQITDKGKQTTDNGKQITDNSEFF